VNVGPPIIVEDYSQKIKARDSVAEHIQRQLETNAGVLLAAMRKLHVVRDVDLSGISLVEGPMALALVDDATRTRIKPIARHNRYSSSDINELEVSLPRLAGMTRPALSGVRFERVDFSGARLDGLSFANDTFTVVKFDYAQIPAVIFEASAFKETSFFEFGVSSIGGLLAPPLWRNCSLSAIQLIPELDFLMVGADALFSDLASDSTTIPADSLRLVYASIRDTSAARLDSSAHAFASAQSRKGPEDSQGRTLHAWGPPWFSVATVAMVRAEPLQPLRYTWKREPGESAVFGIALTRVADARARTNASVGAGATLARIGSLRSKRQ
jgi:hypothetical protein